MAATKKILPVMSPALTHKSWGLFSPSKGVCAKPSFSFRLYSTSVICLLPCFLPHDCATALPVLNLRIYQGEFNTAGQAISHNKTVTTTSLPHRGLHNNRVYPKIPITFR